MPVKKPRKTLKGIKVLLIEDDDFLSEILSSKLSDDGGTLLVCVSALEALRTLEQSVPDVIITDLMLPGMSGEELVEKIKLDNRFKDVPIVVFSNKNDSEGMKELLAKGVAEYHIKAQTSLADIPDIIRRVL
jgi:CheY-like chemotaxis protein